MSATGKDFINNRYQRPGGRKPYPEVTREQARKEHQDGIDAVNTKKLHALLNVPGSTYSLQELCSALNAEPATVVAMLKESIESGSVTQYTSGKYQNVFYSVWIGEES